MKNKQYKKALVPELRFPEFREAKEWQHEPFNKAFTRITTKNVENNQNVLTISAQQGLVSQLDYFNKSVAARDVTGYYLLHQGDFAYNKSYSQGYPMGAIKLLKIYDKGVVSTLYICFRAKKGYLPHFFEYYFDAGMLNSEIEHIAQEGGRNHGLLNVGVKDFFGKIYLLAPQPEEQQKIADCLSSVDDLITASTQKLEVLQAHKKGLMQQLFPAEGEAIPKLRFPEFQKYSAWTKYSLAEISTRIVKKVNDLILMPVSITAGHGFVSQIEKFGRDISGQQYKNYIVLNKGEFAYNKGNSKKYPQGCICQLKEFQQVAAPNAFICFRFKSGHLADFYQGYFDNNFHGKQLQKFITSGARSDGLLNISPDDFFKVALWAPRPEEQQKIADCLSSMDELIVAQTQKLEALKAHKKSLMQQLFPAVGEEEA